MDALISIYNQMIDRLREERLKLQEQHYFLEKILAASPAGIVTLASHRRCAPLHSGIWPRHFAGRVSSLNSAAEALLQTSGEEAKGKELGNLGSAVGEA